MSRQTDKLGKQCLDFIGDRLTALGWTGEDLSAYVLKEMAAVILDDARLSADRLAALLKLHGKPGAGQAWAALPRPRATPKNNPGGCVLPPFPGRRPVREAVWIEAIS